MPIVTAILAPPVHMWFAVVVSMIVVNILIITAILTITAVLLLSIPGNGSE